MSNPVAIVRRVSGQAGAPATGVFAGGTLVFDEIGGVLYYGFGTDANGNNTSWVGVGGQAKQNKNDTITQNTAQGDVYPWTFKNGTRSTYQYGNANALGIYDNVDGLLWDYDFGTKVFRIKGGEVWTRNNLNPSDYVNRNAPNNIYGQNNFFGLNIFYCTGKLSGPGEDGSALEARGDVSANGGAYMTFHRPGNYATRVGFNSNNKFGYGGWSEGEDTFYEILDDRNFGQKFSQKLPSATIAETGTTTQVPLADAFANKVSKNGNSGSTFLTATLGVAARTLADRFGEFMSLNDFGVDMTGNADSTSALTAALASGRKIYGSPGTVRVTASIPITVAAFLLCCGDATKFVYDAPAGSAVAPIFDIQKTAIGTVMDGFAVDHQANSKNFKPNTVYAGEIIASSAILVQADRTTLKNFSVSNGYDNGVAVIQFQNQGSNAYNRGSPKYYSIKNVRTFYCGVGSTPKAGAGVDIGAGSQGVVDDLVDVGSYCAFLLDTGAGAQGSFSNLIGIGTKCDPTLGYSFTFYIGGAESSFTNLQAIEPQWAGMWLDGEKNVVTNLYTKASHNIGVLLKAPDCSLTNVTINSPGYQQTNGTVDAIVFDTTNNRPTNVNITNLRVMSEFSQARYGIGRVGTGLMTGNIINADLGGALAPYDPALPRTLGIVESAALGGQWKEFTPSVSYGSGSASSIGASGKYRKVGRTVEVVLNVTQSNIGSASGDVRISLPFTSATRSALNGCETNATGWGLVVCAYEGQKSVLVKKYDGGSVAASNYVLTISGTYETTD